MLSFTAFALAVQPVVPTSPAPMRREAIVNAVVDRHDANGDNALDRAEMKKAAKWVQQMSRTMPGKPLTDAELAAGIDHAFATHDDDKDGKLSRTEMLDVDLRPGGGQAKRAPR